MGRGGGKDKTTEKSGTSDVVFEKKKNTTTKMNTMLHFTNTHSHQDDKFATET